VDIEYVVATDPETLARAAYLTAVKRGAELAEEIIVLGDGANWIWNRITPMFPKHKTTEVLDFYHASEYIWDAGNAVWGQETETAKDWGEKQCHALKHDGPDGVLQALRTLCPANTSLPESVTKAFTSVYPPDLTKTRKWSYVREIIERVRRGQIQIWKRQTFIQ
jgi:hypothetical protein